MSAAEIFTRLQQKLAAQTKLETDEMLQNIAENHSIDRIINDFNGYRLVSFFGTPQYVQIIYIDPIKISDQFSLVYLRDIARLIGYADFRDLCPIGYINFYSADYSLNDIIQNETTDHQMNCTDSIALIHILGGEIWGINSTEIGKISTNIEDLLRKFALHCVDPINLEPSYSRH